MAWWERTPGIRPRPRKSGGHFRDVPVLKPRAPPFGKALCPTHWKGAHIMYLHLGQDTIVNERDIVGVFDLDNSTVSRHTRISSPRPRRRAGWSTSLWSCPSPLWCAGGMAAPRCISLKSPPPPCCGGPPPWWEAGDKPTTLLERLVLLCSILEFPNAPIAKNG